MAGQDTGRRVTCISLTESRDDDSDSVFSEGTINFHNISNYNLGFHQRRSTSALDQIVKDTNSGLSAQIPFRHVDNANTDYYSPSSDDTSSYNEKTEARNAPNTSISSSISYMSRFSNSLFSLASTVTDAFVSSPSKPSIFSSRKPLVLNSTFTSGSAPVTADNVPVFCIPKRTTPPRTERLTSNAELMSYLRNSDPKGFHAAIVYGLADELESEELMYQNKVRDEIEPIDFIETKSIGIPEVSCFLEF